VTESEIRDRDQHRSNKLHAQKVNRMFRTASRRSILLGTTCFAVVLIPWSIVRFTTGQVGNMAITLMTAVCIGLAAFVLQHTIDRIRPETEAEIRALIRFDESGNSLDHLEYETLSRRRRRRTWARFAIAVILFAVAVAMPLLLL
jgi:hypothetical protein